MTHSDLWEKTFGQYFSANKRARLTHVPTVQTVIDFAKHNEVRGKTLPYDGLKFFGTIKQLLEFTGNIAKQG